MDHTTSLKWVRGEIDTLLKRARTSLEDIAEQGADDELYEVLIEALRHTRLVLELLEIYGAALAAEEGENLARALAEGRIDKRDEAFEVLMRALLQIQDYLEKIQTGMPDNPMLIMALLNDIRAVQGLSLFSENSLFSPDLDAPIPELGPSVVDTGRASSKVLADYARKLRPHYQKGLVHWLRKGEDDGDPGLQLMQSVLRHLEGVCGNGPLGRLWWIAGGVMEAMREHGIPTGVSTKQLMSVLDWRIKELATIGADALRRPQSAELLKNMLYYLAQSGSHGSRVRRLREIFDLDALLPGGAGDAMLKGPNLGIISTVKDALGEDLAAIQDSLDFFVRNESTNVAELAPAAEKLQRVGDTLGLMGLGAIRKRIMTQAGQIDEVVGSGRVPPPGQLLDIASAIIETGNVLSAAAARGLVQAGEPPASAARTPGVVETHEQEMVGAAVLQEARTELASVRESVVAFLADNNDQLLAEVPDHMHRVEGALVMLSLPQAAELVKRSAAFIRDTLVYPEQLDDYQIQHFADALVGIEYFLDARIEKRADTQAILDLVEQRLNAVLPDAQEDQEQARPLPDTVADQLREARGIMQQIEGPEVQPAAPEPADVVDPEILEIFVEETAEVLDDIATHLKRLRDDRGDGEALGIVRRAFHTLKGSGRLVGATAIGELAWSLERLLNRLIEHSRAPGQAVLRLIDEVHGVVPELVDAFSEHRRPSTDIEPYVQRAANLEDSDGADEDDDEPPDGEGPGPQGGRPTGHVDGGPAPDSGVPPAMGHTASGDTGGTEFQALAESEPSDLSATPPLRAAGVQAADQIEIPRGLYETGIHDLLEIFINEANGHLGVIQINILPVPGHPLFVKEELLRACHTLGGAAKVARLPVISELFGRMEKALSVYRVKQLPLRNSDQETLIQATDVLRQTLREVGQGRAEKPEDEALLSRVREMHAWAEQQPNPGQAASSGDSQGDDQELLGIFLEEAEELLAACDNVLRNWSPDDDHQGPLQELQRQLHTLKGGARIAGLTPIGDLSHSIESLLVKAVRQQIPVDQGLRDLIQESQDRIADMVDIVLGGGELRSADDLIDRIEQAANHGGVPARFDDGGRSTQPLDDTATGGGWHSTQPLDDTATGEGWRSTQPLDETATGGGWQSTQPLDDTATGEGWHATQPLDETATGEGWHATQPLDETATGEGWQSTQPLGATGDGEHSAQGPGVQFSDPAIEAASPVQALTEGERPFEQAVPGQDVVSQPRPMPGAALQRADDAQRAPDLGERVQVRADELDNLVNFAGEINIARSRLEQQVGEYKANLAEMETTVNRVRDQLRLLEIEAESQILYRHQQAEANHDFDPLELDRYTQLQQLARSLMESVSDLDSIRNMLEELTLESESVLVQQSRVNTELQQGLMNTRLVPIARFVPRLRRLVRQTSAQLHKQVELYVEGEHEELDHTILGRMITPLEHMLRNAVDHGIEPPDQREAAGKPGTGRIDLSVGRDGAELVVRLRDDGRGLDLDAIRRKAIERGDLDEDAALSDEDLKQFVFNQAFSTARFVTQISGRGVGLDVVSNIVKQMGGGMEVRSETGAGTEFHIRLPTTLSITHALMVIAGDDLFAVPLANIDGIVQVKGGELRHQFAGNRPSIKHLGNDYQLQHLGAMLGTGNVDYLQAERRYPVLLVRAGDNYMAFTVDHLTGRQEVVIKPVGMQIGSLSWIAGATILGDGRIVLILDVPALIRRGVALPGGKAQVSEEQVAISGHDSPVVMVVDDSITVRKVTQRFLARHGMEVLLAKDGVEALGILQEQTPDLMLLDVEMPRMDGYELATTVRNDERLRSLPIIMITSRIGRKHSERAKAIGVDRYLGKPYHEAELLESIQEFVGTSHA